MSAPRTTAKSAARALDVLTLLSARPEPATAATIARELRLPRSSLYHLLSVMVDRGFVVHERDENRWGLGPAAREIGTGATRQVTLARLAKLATPTLRRLQAGVAQPVLTVLTVRYGVEALVVSVEGNVPSAAHVRPGYRVPVHASALGRALLLDQSDASLRALYARDELPRERSGPQTWEELAAELTRARLRGACLGTDEPRPGLTTMAAPVLDRRGTLVAALGLVHHTGDGRDTAGQHHVALLRAARTMTSALGHRDQVASPQKRIPA